MNTVRFNTRDNTGPNLILGVNEMGSSFSKIYCGLFSEELLSKHDPAMTSDSALQVSTRWCHNLQLSCSSCHVLTCK